MENKNNGWQAWMNVPPGDGQERVTLHVVRRSEKNLLSEAIQLRKFNQGLKKEVLMLRLASLPATASVSKFLQYSEVVPAIAPYKRIEIYDDCGKLLAVIEEIGAREEDVFT